MNKIHDYIAVFDSGVGGISVLRQLVKQMPQERFLYFGDSANAPYGDRPTAEIRQLSMAVAEKLIPRGIKALVVACNTATAAAIEELRSAYPDLIVVGIEPALKLAAEHFPNGTVGVMATNVTLREEKFCHLVERFSDHCRVIRIPAPGLVELVEAGKANSEETEELLHPLLDPLREELDAVVLGCTHYPFAAPTVAKLLKPGTMIYDGGEGTAKETKRRLAAAGLLRSGEGEVIFENSSCDDQVIRLCQELLEHP